VKNQPCEAVRQFF